MGRGEVCPHISPLKKQTKKTQIKNVVFQSKQHLKCNILNQYLQNMGVGMRVPGKYVMISKESSVLYLIGKFILGFFSSIIRIFKFLA
jgi:hypothetical protein